MSEDAAHPGAEPLEPAFGLEAGQPLRDGPAEGHAINRGDVEIDDRDMPVARHRQIAPVGMHVEMDYPGGPQPRRNPGKLRLDIWDGQPAPGRHKGAHREALVRDLEPVLRRLQPYELREMRPLQGDSAGQPVQAGAFKVQGLTGAQPAPQQMPACGLPQGRASVAWLQFGQGVLCVGQDMSDGGVGLGRCSRLRRKAISRSAAL